jgi:hypothetical protein
VVELPPREPDEDGPPPDPAPAEALVSDDGRNETQTQRSDRNWVELLQELRVMQTGVQILTGFLLTVPFQARWTDITASQRTFYLIVTALAALTTGMVIAPVALHRALFRHRLKPILVTVGDRMARLALVLLAFVVAGGIGLVFDVVVGTVAAVISVFVSLAVLGGLWLVLPTMVRSRR